MNMLTIILAFVARRHTEVLKLLLESGADLYAINNVSTYLLFVMYLHCWSSILSNFIALGLLYG